MSKEPLVEQFVPRLSPRWKRIQVGGGHLVTQEHGLRLCITHATRRRYADAQIDDYSHLAAHHFPWKAPLRLTVRARASGPLVGTAGFGFWNHPFSPLGGVPKLPAALWFFFASPPSNMPLAAHVPGYGWKCACLDATTPSALVWAPLAPIVLLLNRWPSLYQRIWPRVQRALSIAEAPLDPLTPAWQTYSLEWHHQRVIFRVDNAIVLEAPFAPQGPLGFVAWVDNQYAIATPQGNFGWGLLDITEPQWLDLANLHIERL